MPSSIPTLPLAVSVPLTTSASTPNPSQVTAATGPIASTSALALMLNAASGNLPQDALAGDRIFISHGLPTVPNSLLEKIQRWEFIDLVDLLPAQSAHDDLMNRRVSLHFLDVNSSVQRGGRSNPLWSG